MDQLEITFKNGKKDWIDPIRSIRETNKSLIVDNGHYKYIYRMSRIEKYEIVNVQPPEGGQK